MSRFFTLKVRGIQNVYGIQRLIPQAVRRYSLYSFLRTFSTAVLALGFEWYTFSISYRAARSTPPAVSEIFDANKAPTQLVIIMTVNANGSYPASVCAHRHRLQCGTAPQLGLLVSKTASITYFQVTRQLHCHLRAMVKNAF